MSGYFPALEKALQDAGFFRPTLIIDRQRVKVNTDIMLSHLRQDFAYRTVAKSLPAEELIGQVMQHTGSRNIMAFHQPFLNRALTLWPDIDLLLGKPMPVEAVRRFFDVADNSAQAARQVQWLVDSEYRISQYREFAQSVGLTLRLNLELDIGLHRGGFSDPAAVARVLRNLGNDSNLEFSGFMGYDGHVALYPEILGPAEGVIARASTVYDDFIAAGIEALGADWSEAEYTLNTGGSTTYPYYGSGGCYTPANEMTVGSGLCKPLFCDELLTDHQPAMFVSTPVLKVAEPVTIPGLESGIPVELEDGVNRERGYFIYGGRWAAEPVFPPELGYDPIYGRSSNQELLLGPPELDLAADELVFFRPAQSEGVTLPFDEIAVYDNGAIVDTWQTLRSA